MKAAKALIRGGWKEFKRGKGRASKKKKKKHTQNFTVKRLVKRIWFNI